MIYYAHFDEAYQSMVIEDDMGNTIIKQRAYATITPYPGREWTFNQPINLKQWQEIFRLVEKANGE